MVILFEEVYINVPQLPFIIIVTQTHNPIQVKKNNFHSKKIAYIKTEHRVVVALLVAKDLCYKDGAKYNTF